MPSRKAIPRGSGRRRTGRSARRAPVRIAETDPLDAEDIALARLNADLRKTEALAEAAPRPAARTRTTVRLPAPLLQRLRDRARREKRSLSAIIQTLLEERLTTP